MTCTRKLQKTPGKDLTDCKIPNEPQGSGPEKLFASSGNLGGRFGYFLFFLLGGGEGGPRRQKGGGRGQFFIENPRRGGLPGEKRRGGGAEGPGGCLRATWGGGAKYFFRGRNAH